MKKLIFTSLVILAVAILSGCVDQPPQVTPTPSPTQVAWTPNWANYTDLNLKFSLMYPEDWTKELKGYKLFIIGPVDEKGHNPNINIQTVLPAASGGEYKNIDDAAADILNQLGTADNYRLISDTKTAIGGQNARETVTSYSYGVLDLKQNNVFVQDPNAGAIYIIGYTATTVSYPKYIEAYEKAKETFRLPTKTNVTGA